MTADGADCARGSKARSREQRAAVVQQPRRNDLQGCDRGGNVSAERRLI